MPCQIDVDPLALGEVDAVDDGGYLIGKVDVKQSSRGFVGKNSERIRMYSCEGKFEGKFIANLALFLCDEGKFNAQKLHVDARFLLVGSN